MKAKEAACPVTKVAGLLSDTWTMLVMHVLISAPKRFCEIERELAGISTRTLTLKLKKLEQEGLIRKRKDGWYEATRRGSGLQVIISAMRRYEKKYL